MFGLVNRAVERFVIDNYGEEAWSRIAQMGKLGVDSFEPMLKYDDAITDRLITASSLFLGKSEEILFEDLGNYLVSHPNCEVPRRLFRFGGETFADFLLSLDDLPERARLAVPDLEIPMIEVDETEASSYGYVVRVRGVIEGLEFFLSGVLRAMADDYGTLALLEIEEADTLGRHLRVAIHDTYFGEGRKFELAKRG